MLWFYLNVAVPVHPKPDIWKNCSPVVIRITPFFSGFGVQEVLKADLLAGDNCYEGALS